MDGTTDEATAGGPDSASPRPATPTNEALATTVVPVDDRPDRLAAALGLTFHNLDLLRLALMHRSVIHDWLAAGGQPELARSNERLEFLGDAALGLIVAEYVYRRYPDADEGTLTAMRVALVRAETLVRWAREIGLGEYLYLGHGEKITEGARDRMLAGAFEALIGAIVLDRGLRAAKSFLRPFLQRDAETITARARAANPKGALQELLQERFRLAPVYRTVGVAGPAHERVFTVEVALAGQPLARGEGGSKREAQQAAARAALAFLEEHPGESVGGAPFAGGLPPDADGAVLSPDASPVAPPPDAAAGADAPPWRDDAATSENDVDVSGGTKEERGER